MWLPRLVCARNYFLQCTNMMVLSCCPKAWVDHVTSGKAGLTTDYPHQQPYKWNCSGNREVFLGSLPKGIHKSAHLKYFWACLHPRRRQTHCLEVYSSATGLYVSLQLSVQNRRRKWHFPLNFWNGLIWTSPFLHNIRNAINWAGVTSKAFSSSEALISVLSKNPCLISYSVKMPTCMVIFNSFQSKTLYTVLIFKWSCLDTNLWIWNLCIC